ncbi:hypothetical protein C8R43DRAFT_983266 [Mycena crocata]|nr:hypothetical protein C8R43DRAFT_983266 [Mycena crocata]
MDASREKPAFSPRKSKRWEPPPGEDDVGFESVGPVLGNSLIIRSVYTPGSPITTTSAVTIVRPLVARLLDANADLPFVTVHQFSNHKPSSSCYLRILNDPMDPDDTPRFDLLEMWKETIEVEKPGWEIAWQPMSDGGDKRMTVRFPDAGFKKAKEDKTPCAALEKVKAALATQGSIITDSYSTPTSGSYITLADHTQVDSLIRDGFLSIPAVSPNPISVARCRQIEVLHAFEIVISGLAEGEGAQTSICRWISKAIRDVIDNSSCLARGRAGTVRQFLKVHPHPSSTTTLDGVQQRGALSAQDSHGDVQSGRRLHGRSPENCAR